MRRPADTSFYMGVLVDTRQPRRAARPGSSSLHERPAAIPARRADPPQFEDWELHSELTLVCPELRRAALARLETTEYRVSVPTGAGPAVGRRDTRRAGHPATATAAAVYALSTLAEVLLMGAIAIAAIVVLLAAIAALG